MPKPSSARPAARSPKQMFLHSGVLLLLAVAGDLIAGYHPSSEDAGIYVAGIKLALNPGLYRASAPFILAYSRLSIFTATNAILARSLHLPLDYYLLATQVLTTCLLLYACWDLAAYCFDTAPVRWSALLFTCVNLSLPVAGSALFLMDPYLTGRSFSNPLSLLAISACLGRRPFRVVVFLLLAGLFHPLTGIYTAGFLILLWAIGTGSQTFVLCSSAASILAAMVLRYCQRHIVETSAYRAAVSTRSYYFLYEWHWYEILGLAAPLLLLALYVFFGRRHRISAASSILAKACVCIGITSIAISLIFAKPDSQSHLIAAMQTIRPFVQIYYCLFLLLGGVVGEFWLKNDAWRWAIFFLAIGTGNSLVQHKVYASSPHLELPWASNHNAWSEAFLWIRSQTPSDAVFALDADYIHAPGEDAQGFRAITERSSLADSSKDGGAAAAFPSLADRWMREHTAQTGLNSIDDAERLRRLLPFNASWIVLDRYARSALPCPYQNEAVKVCRLI